MPSTHHGLDEHASGLIEAFWNSGEPLAFAESTFAFIQFHCLDTIQDLVQV